MADVENLVCLKTIKTTVMINVGELLVIVSNL